MQDLFAHDLFRHEALPYTGSAQFVPSCAASARDGVENDERVIVLAAAASLPAIEAALGDVADDVTLLALDEHGRNPNRIATLLQTFQSAGDGSPAHGVVDMNLDARSRAAAEEVRFADAVLNVVGLRSWPMSLVCLYDLERLDSEPPEWDGIGCGLHAVRRSHAVVRGQDTNVDYDPDYALELFGAEVEPAPDDAARFVVDGPRLGGVRDFVRTRAAGFGVAADRVDDLVLAVNEIVTNSVRHGGGTGRVTVWSADGSVVCEVRDRGHIADPLAGRFAPLPSAAGGRGLWLANHLCDLVQVRSAPGRSVVRMYVDR